MVGGDAAGMSAASQARRRRPPEDLEIVAFERSPHTSYSACGMPYLAEGLVEDPQDLIARSPETFRSRFTIDARVLHEVTEIDFDSRRVTVTDLGSSKSSQEPFDLLVVTTGTEAVRPRIEGIEAEGVFGLTTLQSGIEVRRALDSWGPKSAVVVGGGYIGLEMAEAFLARGLRTSVVETLQQPMSTLDEDMGALVADALRDGGAEVYLEEPVVGFDVEGGRVTAVVTSQRSIPADIVALGLGTRPAVELARRSGLRIGESGGVWVDDRMRTGTEGVWAAGDCAEQIHRVTGKPVNFHLGTIANKMGRIAGMVIGGEDASFPGVLGTAVTKVCDVEVGRTGLSSAEAETEGFDLAVGEVRSTTRTGYYPGASRIDLKVIAERPGGRLLGAQIVGGEGSAKRIDVFATALWDSMEASDVAMMDLSYAPPFSPVWDPVLIAARRAAEALR